eukprot:CAMPEP_0184685946 /NCGR_PEP_ID=MMETSP0312-20130426/20792_1 /TAXON_ID=31354 /ORGANISM="Compsopogon coeruleus, Strain SAG 36.94" /LENGTH=709 /DNA_ID=CAMNT_0027140563 /DNA_START=366 /DNA_END=2495 /DNA_ORIENTATION=+
MYFERTGPSPIDQLLNRSESTSGDDSPVTLRDFLEETDIISECRAENRRLLEYLGTSKALEELASIVIMRVDTTPTRTPPGDDLGPLEPYRIPSIASEILASEVDWLSERIVSTRSVQTLFFDYLRAVDPGRLDHNIGSLMAKVLSALLRSKHEMFLSHFEDLDDALYPVDLILKHVDCSPLAEVLIRMIDGADVMRSARGSEESPVSISGMEIFNACNIFDLLSKRFLACLSARVDGVEVGGDHELRSGEDGMLNVVVVMKSITHKVLQMPKHNMTVPTFLNLYSVPLVLGEMLDAALNICEKSCQALCFVLDLLIDLLTTKENTFSTEPDTNGRIYEHLLVGMSPNSRRNLMGMSPPSGAEQKSILPGRTMIMGTHRIEALLRSRYPKLTIILRGDLACNSGKHIPGHVSARVGSTRLRVTEFFVACLRHGGEETQSILCKLNVPMLLWELFRSNPLCSMLHCVISNSVVDCFKHGTDISRKSWMEGNLIPNLLQCWDEVYSSPDGWSSGIRGHVIKMMDTIATFVASFPAEQMSSIDPELREKIQALCDGELGHARGLEALPLGGEVPHSSVKTNSDDEEFADVLDMEDLIEGLARQESEPIQRYSKYLLTPEQVPDIDTPIDSQDAHQGFVPLTSLDGPPERLIAGLNETAAEVAVPEASRSNPDYMEDEQLSAGNYLEPTSQPPPGPAEDRMETTGLSSAEKLP